MIKNFYIVLFFLLTFLLFSDVSFAQTATPYPSSEHRAVWLQDDYDLDNKLSKLKAAHFNTVYFGVWGARNLGLQGVINKIHSYGLHAHIWEANSFICAGQWLTTCTNQNNPAWFARLPNGMSLKDLTGGSNYVDFGIPEVRQNTINYMVNYASNYGAEGIHYDYIRYFHSGNWSYSTTNLNNFQSQYGIAPAIARGDAFPVYDRVNANRVGTATTATVLANYQDSVPAILVNRYRNGQVLTFNFDAETIHFKVTDSIIRRAINLYGSTRIYVLYVPGTNDGTENSYNYSTGWLRFMGYTYSQVQKSAVAALPTGSLLIIPGVYSFTDAEVTTLDNHLSRAGNIIFLDGPTTTVARSSLFRNIVGVSGNSSYLSNKVLLTVPAAAVSHPFISGLTGSHSLTFTQASDNIDKWETFMQNTINSVVSGVAGQLRISRPNTKISAAIFPAEYSNNINVHQNWPLWVRSGYLNYAVTMGYTLNASTFTNRLNWLKNNNLAGNVVPGLGPYLITSCSQDTIITNQISELRNAGFRGFVMFESNYLTQSGYTPNDCGIRTALANLLARDVTPYYPSPMANLTSTPTPTPTRTPTPTPTRTPTPTPTPTRTPTIIPTQIPTNTPTVRPTNTPTSVPLKPGDANEDSKVDLLDYVIWLNHFSQTTQNGYGDADFNNDTKVDLLDYVIWLNNYGR